jgi:hypothetical protein
MGTDANAGDSYRSYWLHCKNCQKEAQICSHLYDAQFALLDRLLDPEGPFKVLRVNPELHVYWQRQPSVMLLVRTRDEIREVLGEEKTDD